MINSMICSRLLYILHRVFGSCCVTLLCVPLLCALFPHPVTVSPSFFVLDDGYWHIPMAPSMCPCQRLSCLGSACLFHALPFGLGIAPWIFAVLVLCIARIVSNLGVLCSPISTTCLSPLPPPRFAPSISRLSSASSQSTDGSST